MRKQVFNVRTDTESESNGSIFLEFNQVRTRAKFQRGNNTDVLGLYLSKFTIKSDRSLSLPISYKP